MNIHKSTRKKMMKTKPLIEHPLVGKHIPETFFFSDDEAKRMLEKYNDLFLKPDTGSFGIGIIRLQKLTDSKFEVHYQNETAIFKTADEALQAAKQLFDEEEQYLVQQRIQLAAIDDRPFDFRVVMHKMDGKWQKSGWCAKVSSPDQVVIKAINGADIIPVEEALEANKELFDPKEAEAALHDLCFQICEVYDQHFSFFILALDMVIDRNGHIWFIEANTLPDHVMFKKLKDKSMYAQIMERERYIRQTCKIKSDKSYRTSKRE